MLLTVQLSVLYLIYDIKFTQLFVKANLFANNFEKFYSKESIVNKENISISGITVSLD